MADMDTSKEKAGSFSSEEEDEDTYDFDFEDYGDRYDGAEREASGDTTLSREERL
eukprot:CAMPEP_0170507302 /NCGR_PEP_ID=MMETSP0208-20121228/58389_1 /TAXON_ID=197538 /ORGANISM="Strombidium inclinatum, Strain S3" /LENGTH=54 /DNA_ID=CAMNT_0010789399 /DNA_START=228 /DNA_END=392 /DNA_ORIENTATION=-